jgi:SNF2-related domain
VTYADFIAQKTALLQPQGFEPGPLNHALFPFQRDVTRWALQRGRAALFEECGLGKSWQALEWAQQVADHTDKPVLILTPLAVAQQFVREGEKMGVSVMPLREEIQPGHHSDAYTPEIYVTNYDRLDKFPELVSQLGGIVIDESSILKAFDGKTRTRLIESFRHVPFRLACTATPSPNDVAELGNHAEFLGVMRHVDMLNRFFEHRGDDVSKWTLKGHARKPFWQWISSWAVCVSKPSDLGYSDDGYDLPPLRIHEHIVDMDRKLAHKAGLLFAYEATTLTDQRAVRRASLEGRVAEAAGLVNASPDQWIVWCELNDESAALRKAIPDAVEISGSDSAEFKEASIMGFIGGEFRVLVTKPSIAGFGVNLQNCHRQCFLGVGHSFEAFHQATRRCWRFGQTHPVDAHLIQTSADGPIARNLARKQREHDAMIRDIVQTMRAQ